MAQVEVTLMTTKYEEEARIALLSLGFEIFPFRSNVHHDFEGVDIEGKKCVIEAKTIRPLEMDDLIATFLSGKPTYLIINDLEGKFMLFRMADSSGNEENRQDPFLEPLPPPAALDYTNYTGSVIRQGGRARLACTCEQEKTKDLTHVSHP